MQVPIVEVTSSLLYCKGAECRLQKCRLITFSRPRMIHGSIVCHISYNLFMVDLDSGTGFYCVNW